MSTRSEILVRCNDQLLKITEAPVMASGGLNEIRVVFDFCDKWTGFIKTATFYRDEENVYYAVLDENDTCIVPWEVCYEEGTFFFSVFGEKDNTRRTASVVRCKVKKGAITTDMHPSDPTPELYDQVLANAAQMREDYNAFVEEVGRIIEDDSDGVNFTPDHTLILENGILSVNTTNNMEQDNTLPITSAGVYATVGNIEALLKTI